MESPRNPIGSNARELDALNIVTKLELWSAKFLDCAIGASSDMKYTMVEKEQELTTEVTI